MPNQKRILVIAYKYFNVDPRVIREINALLEKDYQVDFICPQLAEKHPETDKSNLRFFTIPMRRKRGKIFRYVYEYLLFFFFAFFMSTFLFFKYKHRIIKVFVMPEFMVLSCIIPKILGAAILMDWEDPSYELFIAKFGKRRFRPVGSAIKIIEKISAFFADLIITPNEGFRKAFVSRGHNKNKIKIIMNAPEPSIFKIDEANLIVPPHEKFILLYTGAIVYRHGLDIIIKAMALVRDKIPDIKLIMVGGGEEKYLQECYNLAEKLNIRNRIDFQGRVPMEKLPEIILNSDAGIIANRRNPFTEINFPQRILEFTLLKKPVIVSQLPGVLDYFDESSLFLFEPENHKNLAEKILSIKNNTALVDDKINNAYKICSNLEWKEPYIEIISNLSARYKLKADSTEYLLIQGSPD